MRVVFVHGWSFDRSFWEPVIRKLGYETHSLDHGFFGTPDLMIPEDEPVMAVGHSLGLLWLLSTDNLPDGSCILGINGFTRFTRAPDFSAGVAPRVLDRMRTGLHRGAGDVIRQFRTNCGLAAEHIEERTSPAEAGPVPEQLQRGLDLLQSGDARSSRCQVRAALASRDDPIVTVAMTEACFSENQLCWSETGGHLLPLTQPDLCSRFIRNAMERHDYAT
ncbi:alpha/beta hydrolase [Acetobacter sp. LMG 1636]|uniref:Alpha/beta hydrolase n=2 Tax=Acetobacter fallax TaxID=1737473 RepID=A0ABX0K7U9_9PROT|nr:alpha/beta hydrolase [Acetobacter fallax]NHO36030.1 alpha/beta hydrolase [Acetobacter fallax]